MRSSLSIWTLRLRLVEASACPVHTSTWSRWLTCFTRLSPNPILIQKLRALWLDFNATLFRIEMAVFTSWKFMNTQQITSQYALPIGNYQPSLLNASRSKKWRLLRIRCAVRALSAVTNNSLTWYSRWRRLVRSMIVGTSSTDGSILR